MGDGIVFTFDRNRLGGVGFLAELLGHCVGKCRVALGQQDAVLRAFRTGDGWHHGAQIQFKRVGEHGFGLFGAPVALRLRIGFNQRHAICVAARTPEVFDRIIIDREEAARGAIFRRHVRDRRFIFERDTGQAGAEEFDKLSDDALLAQHLDDRENEICCGCAFGQFSGQFETDDFRNEHRDRLAEHGGFRFDAAHTPAQHGQGVDHGRVAVGADAGVRIGNGLAVFVFRPDGLAKVFEVHLVADAGARRHDTEILERGRAPAQELIPFLVALILHFDVFLEAA